MKRLITLVLCMFMAASVFAGCGTSNEKAQDTTATIQKEQTATAAETTAANETTAKAAEPVTITYYRFNGANGQEDTLNAIIDDFQKKNEGITVKMEVIPFDGGNYFTKLKTALSAGNVIDVFETNYENFYAYAMGGVLKDLDDIIAADSSFKPDMIKKGAYDSYKYNGKQYGICTDYSGCLMYYNKDLFDAAGVAYPTENWTWKDELAAAQKLTDAKKGIWGTMAPYQAYEFYKTIAQNGGSVWSADNTSVTINSKEVVDAVQWMIDKSSKYKVQPPMGSPFFKTSDYDTKAFETGKIAMIRCGSWMLDTFLKECKFKFDAVVEPGNTAKAHNFFSNANVVTADSKAPEAGWKLIKYLATDSFSVDNYLNKMGALPVVNDDTILAPFIKKTPPDNRKAILDIANTAVNVPLGPVPDKWGQVSKIIGDQLDLAAANKVTVQKAMDEAKAQIEALMK